MGKNENRELNAILAKLKKSYSDDQDIENAASQDTEDDFQMMLSNYFSDDSNKDVYKFTAPETPDAENITLESDYSLADFEEFTVEEAAEETTEDADETVVEEVAEDISEETVEEAEDVIEEAVEETEEIVEETVEAVTEDIAEETVEEIIEEVVCETIDETIDETIEETVEEVKAEPEEIIDDKAIVDDVFAVMFPARATSTVDEAPEAIIEESIVDSVEKTVEEAVIEAEESVVEETEEEGISVSEVKESEPAAVKTESLSKMFDLDEFNDYGYYDSSVIDLPSQAQASDTVDSDGERLVFDPEEDKPQVVQMPVVEDTTDDTYLKNEPKQTIDDIIGDMSLDVDDEIVLDTSAIIDTTEIDDSYVVPERDPKESSSVEYLTDPLQGHLSDAAFVSYKIDSDDVNFDIGESDSDLDDEDISLLLDFGYDDEVEAEVGYERTSEIKRKRKIDIAEGEKIFGYSGEEFTSRSQITKIKNKYSKDKRELLIRGGIFASLTVVLFFLSMVACIGPDINYLLYFVLEFVILGIASAIVFSEIRRGVIGLIKLEPNYYTIPTVVLSLTLTYDLFAIIYVLATPEVMLVGTLLPCAFVAALFIATPLACDVLQCFSESDTFEIVADAEELYTAERFNKNKMDDAPSGKRRERTSLNGAFFGDHIFEIKKTNVPSGYFSKISKKSFPFTYTLYLSGAIIVTAIVIACIALVKSNSIATAAFSYMTVMLMGLPVTLSLFVTLPKFVSARMLKEKRCAIVGDDATEECDLMETLIFKDDDAIEVVKRLEIRPKSDSDVAASIKLATRALKALGGPVSMMIGVPSDGKEKTPEISLTSVRDNGIEFYMDSSIYMLIGDAVFMSSFGIKVSSDYTDKSSNVIYIAIDGVPKLGYVISSRVKQEFISLVKELDKHGIKSAVRSLDPTINDYYFEQNRIHGMSAISTYKPDQFYGKNGKILADGGIFATGDPKNIIYPLLEAKKHNKLKKTNKLITLLLSIAGCLISVAFVIFVLLENTHRVLTLATILMILFFHLTAALPAVLNSFDFKKKESETKK